MCSLLRPTEQGFQGAVWRMWLCALAVGSGPQSILEHACVGEAMRVATGAQLTIQADTPDVSTP